MEEKKTYVLGHRHKRTESVEKRAVQGTLGDCYEGRFVVLEGRGKGENFCMFWGYVRVFRPLEETVASLDGCCGKATRLNQPKQSCIGQC